MFYLKKYSIRFKNPIFMSTKFEDKYVKRNNIDITKYLLNYLK